jgi:hypothetical protein
MQILHRHGFYSELYTDEEIKHLARAFRKKRGDKRSPLEDEQKFLRIVILRLARGLFGTPTPSAPEGHLPQMQAEKPFSETRLPVHLGEEGRGFSKDDLNTFEKILSAIGHLATLERVRLAAEGGTSEEEGDSIFEALAAMDRSPRLRCMRW